MEPLYDMPISTGTIVAMLENIFLGLLTCHVDLHVRRFAGRNMENFTKERLQKRISLGLLSPRPNIIFLREALSFAITFYALLILPLLWFADWYLKLLDASFPMCYIFFLAVHHNTSCNVARTEKTNQDNLCLRCRNSRKQRKKAGKEMAFRFCSFSVTLTISIPFNGRRRQRGTQNKAAGASNGTGKPWKKIRRKKKPISDCFFL